MSNSKTYNVALVGATGAVGTQILRLLEERNFPVGELKCLSSARSAGATLNFKGQTVIVEEATQKASKVSTLPSLVPAVVLLKR